MSAKQEKKMRANNALKTDKSIVGQLDGDIRYTLERLNHHEQQDLPDSLFIGMPLMRSNEELINRALILCALCNIACIEAPIHEIKSWIEQYNLTSFLSESEKILLDKKNEDLTKQEIIDISWFVESLWALVWAGGLIKNLPVDDDQDAGNNYVKSFPDFREREGVSKFRHKMRIRTIEEICEKLNLYCDAHWYAKDGRINNYPTGKMDEEIIRERRKSLEWIMDDSLDWDNIPLDT